MRRRARTVLAALLVVLGTAAAQDDAPRLTTLSVDPLIDDEGAIFAFRATIENPTGSIVNHRWDFGDGTVIESILDLSRYRHRYRQDGTYTVTLEVDLPGGGSDRRSIGVTVRNVPPQVLSVRRSNDPLAGAPVTFTASVVDPGDDRLTLVWDFGDGSPPVTRHDRRDVTHTYETDGAYPLTLVVSDGDDGEDTYVETVFVGTGMVFEATGAVTGSAGKDDTPSLTGLPVLQDGERLRFSGNLAAAVGGDDAVVGAGPCLVVVSNRGMSIAGNLAPGLVLHLSAALPQGLAEGTYPVAAVRNVIPIPLFDPYERELSSPGTFFVALAEIGTEVEQPRNGFHGTGGSVNVHRFDGERVELTFDVRLEEHLTALDAINAPGGGLVFPPAAQARVRGRLIHDVARDMLARRGSLNPVAGAGFGDWYLCDSSERLELVAIDFGVVEGWPSAGSPSAASAPVPENLPWERDLFLSGAAKLEFTVDRPVLRSSLTDRTVIVDVYQTTYANTGEPFMPVPGTIEFVDDRTFRFVPDADLRPGVHYEVKLRGGPDGARGAAGETLDEDLTWRLSTRVELATVTPQVYQVARNVVLVPGKTTMTRVYALWDQHRDLPPESQVDRFRADVSVLVDGSEVYAPLRRVEIVRHDRLRQGDLDAARDSVNLFGWVPTQAGGTSTMVAVVEPSDQPQTPPVRFESDPLRVRHWSESPILSVSYFFLRTGSWRDGVPIAEKVHWHEHMQRSIALTEQLFPVVEARARYGGEVSLLPDPLTTWEIVVDDGVRYRFDTITLRRERTDGYLARRLRDATLGHSADFVVGIMPQEVQPRYLGVMWYLGDAGAYTRDLAGPRVILLADAASTPVLAHELAHGYGVCHVFDDATNADCQNSDYEIDGFRIDRGGRGGAVKWYTLLGGGLRQANGDGGSLFALMEEYSLADAENATARTFVTNQEYHRLVANVPQRDGRAAGTTEPPAIEAGVVYAVAPRFEVMAVSGTVLPDGSVVVERLAWLEDAPSDVPAPDSGPYLAEVLDADGRVLARLGFDALPALASHGPTDAEAARFYLLLPAPAGTHRLVVSRAGRTLSERVRSPHAPEVTVDLYDGDLVWSAFDADGDDLIIDLAYAADGRDWTPLAIGLQADRFTLPDDLEPGPRPTLRVRVSDGFDTTEATLHLPAAPPLRVLATLPADGGVLDRGAAVQAFFNAPLAADDQIGRVLAVVDDEGNQVAGESVPFADGRALLLLTAAPLAPGAYHATLTGAHTATGAALEAPVTWSFSVTAEADPRGSHDGATTLSIPDSCGGVPRAALDALIPADADLRSVSEVDGCVVEVRLFGSVADARPALELSLVRGRYRLTRNAQEGEAVVVAFENAEVSGEARLSPEGGDTLLRLEVRSR